MASRRKQPGGDSIRLAPVVLVRGAEGFLADRAIEKLRDLAYKIEPNLERTDINVSGYQAGQLDMLTSPSLFGEARLLTISGLEGMGDALLKDLLSYITHPAEDMWLLLRHGGGMRGKKLLDAIGRSKFPVIAADPLKKNSDKFKLIQSDIAAAHRHVDNEAIQALVDALGNDVRGMMAALSQLLSDVEGDITLNDVRRYYAGRNEITVFEVADAVISANTTKALMLVRHSFATGTAPIPMIAMLAKKLRDMAKVSISGRGSERSLGMAPWQVDRVRRDLSGWTDRNLAAAITAVAIADEEAKGLSKDPQRAVEKCVMRIGELRGGKG